MTLISLRFYRRPRPDEIDPADFDAIYFTGDMR
jgi:hypothetical protein